MLPSSNWLGHKIFNLKMRNRSPLGVLIYGALGKSGRSRLLVTQKNMDSNSIRSALDV